METGNALGVRWGEWIGEGWQMFVERWQVWVLQLVIVLGLFMVPLIPFYAMIFSAQMAAAQTGSPPEPSPLLVPFAMGFWLLMILAGAFFWGGLWRTAIKQLRGEPIAVRDLFSGGDVFLRILGAFIVIGILASIGAIFCLFPALIVVGLTMFTIPLIVDRNIGVGEALSASVEATKQNWLMFALFAFVVAILAAVGQFACYIGLLATYPLQFTIIAIAYRDMFGIQGARRFGSGLGSSAVSYAGQPWPVQSPQATPPAMPPAPSAPAQQPVQGQVASYICPQCGAGLTRAANFCNFCGARLQL